MALRIAQGFETVRDDSDLRTQGWSLSPAATAVKKVAAIPSVTGVAGWSLRQIGAYSAMSGNTNWGVSGDGTFGYLPTGFTVAQAYAAGGVTVGFGALFNSGVAASFGNGGTGGSSINPSAICFDGALYWAIRIVGGSTYSICTSSNLTNWTATASQPFTPNPDTTLSYAGNGVIVAMYNPTATANALVWITTNSGASWTSVNLATNATALSTRGAAVATGTSSAPHAVSALQAAGSGTINIVSVGNLATGSMTTVLTGVAGNTSEARNMMRPYSNNGVIVLAGPDSGSQPAGFVPTIVSATIGNANIATSGAWSKATLSGIGRDAYPTAIEYHPTSNLWIVAVAGGLSASVGGIYTFPNTGAAGTAVPPTGTVTCTQRYSTTSMSAVFKPSSSATTLVAVGWAGHIITSADGGITWTEVSPRIIQSGTTGTDWASCFFDGSRYVLTTDATSGIIATSDNLLTNYQAQYVMESAEVSWTVGTNNTGTGLLPVTAPPDPTTGQFTQTSGRNTAVLQVGSPSAGSRAVAVWGLNPNSAFFSTNLSTSTAYHYYEMKYTAVAGTNNMFTCSLYIDSTLIGTTSNIQMVATSDTTSSLVFATQRNGCWTAFDDIRITLDNGVGLSGAFGAINIMARRPTADVQAQFTRTGTAASNALSVSQNAISSQSANFVSSNNAGDQDIYSSSTTVPAGYTVKALVIEGYFARTSTSTPTVSVQVISSGSSAGSAATSIPTSTPTYVSAVVENNPNGNVPWTNATANASQLSITHVS